MLVKALGGFLMALADSVPGVSGGTIAFIIGIYDEFITSLNNIASKDKEKRFASWKFLLQMGIGWVSGMILAALVITSVFETHIYQVSSLFLAFVLCSIPLIIMEEKETLKGGYWNAIFAVLGAAVVVAITIFSKKSFMSLTDLSVGNLNVFVGIYIFVAAMIAISAMVLPGISGSTIMLVFGIYQAVMFSIKGFLHGLTNGSFWFHVPGLTIFGLGVITGIVTIVKLLKVGLEKKRKAMVYFILGMMIGSLYAIVQGPTAITDPQPAMDIHTFSPLFFIIGAAIIAGLQFMKRILVAKQEKKEDER